MDFASRGRHASVCSKKPDRNPTVLLSVLGYIWRCLPVALQHCSVSFSLSLVIFDFFFFAFSCYMKITSTLSGAFLTVVSRSHFLLSFLHISLSPLLSSYLTFFCCMQISFSLCLTVSCDDTATSDLPFSRPEGVLYCMFVCVWKHLYPLKHVWLFVYVWHSKSLFLVTSITVLLCQLN